MIVALDQSIAPEWDATAIFMAVLYGVWAGGHWISGQSTRSDGSAAGMVVYVLAFLVGLVACLAVFGVLGLVLRFFHAALLRGLALILVLLVLLVSHGWPHWLALLLGAWFSLQTYWHLRRAQQDKDSLAEFE